MLFLELNCSHTELRQSYYTVLSSIVLLAMQAKKQTFYMINSSLGNLLQIISNAIIPTVKNFKNLRVDMPMDIVVCQQKSGKIHLKTKIW